jgi:peptidoglycan hydrolase-like protein with peptidoglycan-binding domain
VSYEYESSRSGASVGGSSLTGPDLGQRGAGAAGPGKQTLTAQLPVVQREAAAPGAAVSGHRTLSLGASGPDVQRAQALLNQHGASPPLDEDGQFGPMTRNAVAAFQRAGGLVPDGVMGPHTWAALGPAGSAVRPASASLVPGLATTAAPATSAAPAPAAGAGGAWDAVLPRLQAKNHASNTRDDKVAAAHNEPGKAPTVTYNAAASETIPGAGDDAAVVAAVQAVLTARQAIPARPIGRDPLNKKGNTYNPDLDKSGAADPYEAWRKTARPSVQFVPGDAADERKWQIFTKLWSMEGNPGLVTTFDNTLSIGVGFSSAGGQAERVLGYALDRLPEVKAAAFAAGLEVQGGNIVVVETNKKVILSGLAAAAYVQTVPELISFISNICLGVQTGADGSAPQPDGADKQRQTMLDAQWATINSVAMKDLPADILFWDMSSVTLVVHARHAILGTFPYEVFRANGQGTENVIRTIYNRLRATNQLQWYHPIVNGIFDALGKKIEADEKAREAERQREEHNQHAIDNLTNHLYEELQEDGLGHADEDELDFSSGNDS